MADGCPDRSFPPSPFVVASFATLRVSQSVHSILPQRFLWFAIGKPIAHVEAWTTGLITCLQRISYAQAKGFSLFMLKAVLNGCGDELIDLAKVNLFR
jgi:hypothetical protein